MSVIQIILLVATAFFAFTLQNFSALENAKEARSCFINSPNSRNKIFTRFYDRQRPVSII